MASDGNAEQLPTVDVGNNDPKNQQGAKPADSENPNTTSLSVVSPQKQDHLPYDPENTLGSLGKRPSSDTSSRSSKKTIGNGG